MIKSNAKDTDLRWKVDNEEAPPVPPELHLIVVECDVLFAYKK